MTCQFPVPTGIWALLTMMVLFNTPRPAPPPNIPCPAPPLFTEDFEHGLDSARWTSLVTGENYIRVQSEKAAHGKNALLVRCPAASNKTWAFIMTNKLPSSLSKHHFGRAYVFLKPQPPLRHTIFIMAGTPGFPNNKYQEVATAQAKWQLTYVDLDPKGAYEDWHWGGSLPIGRWFCLEWEFNDHPSHTALWVDGAPVFETDFVRKPDGATQDLVGSYDEYAFGFRLWGDALAPFDIYFDDIALDNKRIGP